MNTLIIDDELLNVKNLQILLTENFQSISIIGTFTDVDSASEFINSNEVDLIFLDINMPFKDGFDLLDLFPERAFEIVFVTAYEEYALKAIKAGAIDYILKPIMLSELSHAIEKVLKINKEKHQLFELTSKTESTKITLSYSGGKSVVNFEDIVYIQGIDNLSKVFLRNNQRIIVSKTLKHFDEILGKQQFFRIHKSYIVNLDHCEKIHSKSQHILEMSNHVKIPISRRKFKPFNDAFEANISNE